MFNNIKRNLTIFNKDLIETSWLKSLIDDVPKQKHLQTLRKCFQGEHPNVDPKIALKKISQRLQHIQKPVNALKTIYLVHQMDQFLISYLSDKMVDESSKDPADVLMANLAHHYCFYLKSPKNTFEQINNIFRMLRQLEVLLIKTNLPILKEIIAQLLIDLTKLHSQLDFQLENQKSIRALKQIKRFIELKCYLQLPKELQNALNSISFQELQQPRISEIKICKTIPVSMEREKIQSEPKEDKLAMSIQIQEPLYFDSTLYTTQERKMSLQTAPNSNRSKFVPQNSTRACAIKNNFFVPKQGPLSFLIPG